MQTITMLAKVLCLMALSIGLAGNWTLADDTHSTIFQDITEKGGTNCSQEYSKMLLNEFNYNRAINDFAPLALSEMLTSKAERLSYAVTDIRYTTWRSDEFGALYSEVSTFSDISSLEHNDFFKRLTLINMGDYYDHLSYRHPFWSNRVIPPKGKENYTTEKWSATRRMGVACSTMKGRTFITRRVVMFFDYPDHPATTTPATTTTTTKPTTTSKPTTTTTPGPLYPKGPKITFKEPTESCPEQFHSYIHGKLNSQRIKPFSIDKVIEKEAQHLASTLSVLNEGELFYAPYGQLNWQQWFFKNERNQYDLYPEVMFQNKWGKKSSYPLYSGEKRIRLYTDKEWNATDNIGIGCSLHRVPKFKNFIRFHVMVLFQFKKGPAKKLTSNTTNLV